MEGILNVLKPPGMTSHDVVDYVRRLTRLRRVGHAGTLDPGAAGVLIVCLGRATRLARFLHILDKTYRAEITFGYRTSTQDVFGRILATSDASGLTELRVASVLPQFLGTISQVPPMVSAIKYRGKKLYDLARDGVEVPRAARQVTICNIDVIGSSGWGSPHPRLVVDIACSKGTYIRTLCADIGEALGCGACLSFLLRLRVGRFDIRDAYTLEELHELAATGRLGQAVCSFDEALAHLPPVEVKEAMAERVLHGQRLTQQDLCGPIPAYPGELVRLRCKERLLAVAEVGAAPMGIVLSPVWVNAKPLQMGE